MLKSELQELGKKLGLSGLSSLTKDELVARIRKVMSAGLAKDKTGKASASDSASGGKAASKGSGSQATKTPLKSKGTEASGQTAPTARRAKAAKSEENNPPRPTSGVSATTSPEAGMVTTTSTAGAVGNDPPETSATLRGVTSVPGNAVPLAGQESGSPPRRQSSSPAILSLAEVDARLPNLPEGYADNRIRLLPRDPRWLYTYWDVTNEHKEQARRQGGKFLCLRLYDVTGIAFDGTNARAMWEQEVHELARNWYLHVPAPGRHYCVEIGYRGAQADWLPLARSNVVMAPHERPAERVQDEFVTIPFDRPLTMGPAHPAAEPPSGSLAGMRPGPEMGALPSLSSAALAWSGELPAWSGVVPSLWSAAWSGVAGSQPGPQKGRGFWLRADAELIVYGATEPGAKLRIGGKSFPLAPDGTFFIRVHFPDGMLDFPVEATSPDDEEERSIRLTFNRRTQ